MKSFLLICSLIAFLPACNTPAKVTVGRITVQSSSRAGGKGMIAVQHEGTSVLIADHNEDSFREINKTARFGIGVSGAVGMVKDLNAAFTSTRNAGTAAGVSKAAGQEATKQAAIAADVSKSRIAAEAAASAP